MVVVEEEVEVEAVVEVEEVEEEADEADDEPEPGSSQNAYNYEQIKQTFRYLISYN